MIERHITRHAVEQYRIRVLGCPERHRADDTLRCVIGQQLIDYKMSTKRGATVVICGPVVPKRRKPWAMRLNYPTHMFVIDGLRVVTTLGFMMQPKKKASQKAKARRYALYRQRVAALPSIAHR